MTNLGRAFCGAAGLAAVIASLATVAPARADEPIKVTFIDADKAGNPFFNPIRKGTADAAKAYGVDVDFQYADLDPAKLNDIVETAINNKVQGIVVQMYTPGAYKTSLEHAREAGITVISFNIDDPTEPLHKYVGQDLEGAGYKIGQYLIAQAKLKKGAHVVAAAGDVNASDLGPALQGRRQGPFRGGDHVGTDRGQLRGRPVADAHKPVSHRPSGDSRRRRPRCRGHRRRAGGCRGRRHEDSTVGFDITPIIAVNIRKGLTLGSVDQQPYLQGFLPIMMIGMKAKYGLSPFSADTGDAIVDKSGVDLVQNTPALIANGPR